MRKKKVYLSQLNPRKAGVLGRFIPVLMGDVVFRIIEKFDLPGQVAELPLIDLFSFFHIEPDTVIQPMTATKQQVVDAINGQSGIHLEVSEVDVVGIDIGNESIVWIMPKPHMQVYGISGTPAIRFKNPSNQILLPRLLKDSEYQFPVSHRWSQYHSLMNALAIIKAYDPSANQQQEIPA
jgi:hypothetical protein